MKVMREQHLNGIPMQNTSGFTLMEVVIALLVTAVTIPLLLGALGASAESRRDMAADTTAAWIARDTRTQLLTAWEDLEGGFSFPAESSETPALVILYTQDGTFLTEIQAEELQQPISFPGAFFVSAVYPSAYLPHPSSSADPELALAKISTRITYPAKAAPQDRQRYFYQTISATKGRWK